MKSSLKGKRILFIGPVFYHYHTTIISVLEEKGAEVNFFPERGYRQLAGVYKMIGEKAYEKYQEKYYDRLWESIISLGLDFDYFFLIKGELVPVGFVEKIKSRFKPIRCIQYQWDSARRNKFTYLLPYFEKNYSFDPEDCKKYNLIYKPLFYTRQLHEIRNSVGNQDIDLLLLGTYLPERYELMIKLQKMAAANNLKLFCHLAITKKHYHVNRLKGVVINKGLVNFNNLPYKEVISLYQRSKCIVDISNTGQTGLSMRTIEALGAGRKLITTNPQIVKETFYDPEIIQLLDTKEPVVSDKFVRSEGKQLNIEQLYLANWLEEILL